jgi:hypothetical protein
MGGVASYKVTASNGSRFTVGAYKSGSDLDYIRVYRPDGTEYSYDSFGYVPYGRVSVAADMTGTWRIDVINSDGSSPSWQESVGAFTVDVAWVTTQSITPGNTTISSPALRMGGLAVYTFSATQGERLTVGAYKNGGGNDRISIIRPDGSEYGSDTFYSSDPYGHVSILPDVSGTWMIFLGNTDGASASWQEAAGAFTFDLATVSTQSITPGNTTISSPALRMGGRAVYTFSATQGERLTVGAYKNGGGSDIIWVIRPDGSEYGRDTFYSSDPYGHVSILPDVSGTWMIYLANTDGASASWQEAAGAFTFTLRPT